MKLKFFVSFPYRYLCIRFLASIGSLSTFSITSNNFMANSANTLIGKFRKAGFAMMLRCKEINYNVILFLNNK